MSEEKMIMFRNRLQKVYRHLSRQAKRLGVTCYRLYDHDLPEFPICVEIYEDKLYVAEYKRAHGMDESQHEEWIQQTLKIASEVTGTAEENIFLRLRQRKEGRLGQYQRLDKTRNEIIVNEGGLKFIVNLSDYLDTGLFLDHRTTRQMVKDESTGKNVLNLFSYTGSFSVYAASGNAASVTSVDLSKTYLEWSEKNMRLNGFEDGAYKFVHADVKQWLKTLQAASFDLIVMDPPTFSNSKRMDDFLDIQRDHVDLINDCLHVLKPGGVLYFSTNARKFVLEKEKISASSVKDITRTTTPFDFEGRLFRWCFKFQK
jgi:23S rRNA (cytosine1962-C5)-methyltransferase